MWSSQQLACMVLHTCILFEAYLQTQAHFHTGCSVQLTGNFQLAKKKLFLKPLVYQQEYMYMRVSTVGNSIMVASYVHENGTVHD